MIYDNINYKKEIQKIAKKIILYTLGVNTHVKLKKIY
jgi:hypothetical protein